MARAKQRTSRVEEARPYVEGVAKNLLDKLYGPDGPAWGTKLTKLEDLFVAIREQLSEQMLADALARQAAAQAQGPRPIAPVRAVSTRRPAGAERGRTYFSDGERGRMYFSVPLLIAVNRSSCAAGPR
jgi:hypothetical protein